MANPRLLGHSGNVNLSPTALVGAVDDLTALVTLLGAFVFSHVVIQPGVTGKRPVPLLGG